MRVENPNLVAVDYHFFIDGKEYKVITFGANKGVKCWYCMSLRDNNNKFSISKTELDEKLRQHKMENKHLMF